MALKLTKRILSGSFALLMSGCLLGNSTDLQLFYENNSLIAEAASTANGQCGSGLTWSLTGSTLKITGTGASIDSYWGSSYAPWYSYRSSIKTVILPKTLKKIGAYAFYNMTALEYVYANGAPALPNLTEIEDYAFYGCSNLRGCTESGSLTFGVNSEADTLTIKRNAFYNCNQIRFLKSNYKKIIVQQYGLQRMQRLQTVNFGNTNTQLESYAFNNNSSLTSVYIKESVLPIHNTAFNTTPYEKNGCTNASIYGQNYGNAKKMIGNQLIVNIFVDTTTVNDNVRNGSASYIFPLRPNEVAVKKGTNIWGTNQYFTLDKNNITYSYKYSWNPRKTTSTKGNTAVSLNKFNYSTLYDYNQIPKNVIDNSVTNGFYGSNVTSTEIKERLADVRSAADDLEKQSRNYTSNTLKFEMHPETNFYLTYDSFDWTTQKMTFDNISYNVYCGYSDPTRKPLNSDTKPDTTSNNPLFSIIKQASQQHTGGVQQTVNLLSSSGTSLSPYTNYLKQQYNVDGVVYLIHFNLYGKSTTNQIDERIHEGTDEFVFAFSKTGSTSGQVLIEHEMCHMYGAADYYGAGSLSSTEAAFCREHYATDIMISSSDCMDIGPATAYALGWLDRFDNSSFENIYASSRKK